MSTYRILKETAPNVFTATGETFDGTADEAQAHVDELKLADPQGKCYAADNG